MPTEEVPLAESENWVPTHILVLVAVPVITGEILMTPGSASKTVAVTVEVATSVPMVAVMVKVVLPVISGKVITVSVAVVLFTLKLAAGVQSHDTVPLPE
jgi:hypothetical protein